MNLSDATIDAVAQITDPDAFALEPVTPSQFAARARARTKARAAIQAYEAMRASGGEAEPVAWRDDVQTVRDWLDDVPDLELNEIAADGGVTVGMVLQSEAEEMRRRLDRALRAHPATSPVSVEEVAGIGDLAEMCWTGLLSPSPFADERRQIRRADLANSMQIAAISAVHSLRRNASATEIADIIELQMAAMWGCTDLDALRANARSFAYEAARQIVSLLPGEREDTSSRSQPIPAPKRPTEAPSAGGWRETDEHEFELECNGMWVAGANATSRHDALREVNHYAAQYASEGPCEVFEIKKLRRPAGCALPAPPDQTGDLKGGAS